PTDIHTLSLHDALPIYGEPALEVTLRAALLHLHRAVGLHRRGGPGEVDLAPTRRGRVHRDADRVLQRLHRGEHRREAAGLREERDRKSTRLNSSHLVIS